jgi:hypothetical protein
VARLIVSRSPLGTKKTARPFVDLVRAWPPPFDPGLVTGEIAEVLKGYDVLNVTGDNYAGEWRWRHFGRTG